MTRALEKNSGELGVRKNSVCRMELAYVTEDISKMTFKLKLAKLGASHAECGEKNTPGKRNDLGEGPRLEKGLTYSRNCQAGVFLEKRVPGRQGPPDHQNEWEL